jgi:hypothetical protein
MPIGAVSFYTGDPVFLTCLDIEVVARDSVNTSEIAATIISCSARF